MDLQRLIRLAETLPDDIKATADLCGDDLELRLELSLHWAAARKLAEGMRALLAAERASPPRLRLVR